MMEIKNRSKNYCVYIQIPEFKICANLTTELTAIGQILPRQTLGLSTYIVNLTYEGDNCSTYYV